MTRTVGDMTHFFVTSSQQPNYVHFCSGLDNHNNNNNMLQQESSHSKIVSTFQQYTRHETQLCTKVNLSLAADSTSLKQHGDFIRDLRQSILVSPMLHTGGTVFRGVDLSKQEISAIEGLGHFFFPSFTSTSVSRDKCYNKDALLVIKIGHNTRFGATMTPEFSPYAQDEEEVLLSCYTAMWLEKNEKVAGKHILTLALDDYGCSLQSLSEEPKSIF
eukprot:TRINITY_DN66234_c11_g1_i6.p1 TRINITY_DN66234_c11_g1~~TRINITY_DN66234_c11_g1_i6.p1  ORF type:complete len:250 (+),score=33.52 TRINITY_DN66234_c11_g1_i6:100-750(+)